MIIKYAYAYANPTGTFYIGLRTGVVTYALSATVMATIARTEGGVLCELRRHIEKMIGDSELFEMVNVTPQRITDRGIYAAEEIKELYDLCKFDGNLDDALKSYAKQVHEVLESSVSNADRVLTALKGMIKADLILDAKIDENDPNVVFIKVKVPPDFIITKGVIDGSQNRP